MSLDVMAPIRERLAARPSWLNGLYAGNARAVISRCHGQGIRVCGVVKGADGLPEVARTMRATSGVMSCVPRPRVSTTNSS